MRHSFYVLAVLCLFLGGCRERVMTMNEPHIPMDSLERLVYQKGDTAAYLELRTAAMDYASNYMFYPALMMANRYDYPIAYYDVYYALIANWGVDVSDDSAALFNMDLKTRAMAIQYLQEAVIRNEPNAINTLKNPFFKTQTFDSLVHLSRKK